MDRVKMKKKLLLFTIIAFLSIVLFTSSLNEIKFANAATIFTDSFQSGSLVAWTPYYGTLNINNQTTNNGDAYSIQNIIVGSNENLYYHSLGPSLPNPIDLRQYVYINSTQLPSTNKNYYEVGGFAASGAADLGDGEISIFNVGGTLYWGLYYRDVANTNVPPLGFSSSISNDNLTSDAHSVSIGWNCVELAHTTGASASSFGREILYLNGIPIVNITADNYDRTPASVVLCGSQAVSKPTDTWNYYVDDVAVAGNYIGQIQNQLTTSTNLGTISPSGTNNFNESQLVTITATPPTATAGERYYWQGWNGAGAGSYTGSGILSSDGVSYQAQVQMNGSITETASWQLQYQLTIFSSYGTAIGNSTWYPANTYANAVITPTKVGNPENSTIPVGTQYVFTGWSPDALGTGSTSNAINMTGPMNATANWQTQYYLTVSSAYGTPGGAGFYNSGATEYATTPLSVSASGTQYVFTGWSGDASGTTSPSNAIVMDGPKTAVTNWQTQYNLTFTQTGVGSDFLGAVMTINGTTYSSAGFSQWVIPGSVYNFGYASPLIVTANGEQYLLTAVSGNSSASLVTVSQPTTITGAYKIQYYLAVSSAYDTPSPTSSWYDNNTGLSAFVSSPSSGYTCTGWIGTGSVPASGGTSAVTFAISAPSAITWTWQASGSMSTPSPIPTNTPTPTPKPSNTPTSTPTKSPSTSPTPKPSSPTPKPSQSPQNFATNPYVLSLIIAIILAVIIATILVIRKRNSKQ
jgi:uncharacterized repeat protein (TIGR02543 family)